jgi:hypothetical protein
MCTFLEIEEKNEGFVERRITKLQKPSEELKKGLTKLEILKK